MKKMLKMLLLSAAASLALAGPSLADTFTYSGFSVTPGLPVTVTDLSLGINEQVQGGEITLTGSGPNLGQDLMAWCVDLIGQLQQTGTYNIVPFTSGSTGNGNPSLGALTVTEMASAMLAAGLNDNPLATQLAIWRIEYGSDLSFSSSNAIVGGDIVLSQALALDAESGGSQFNPTASLDLLDAPLTDQVLAVPRAAVPLPASLAFFGSGLIALGWLRNRRRSAPALGRA